MSRLIGLCLLFLAACGPSGPVPQGAFRTNTAPIYSNAVLQTGRLAGRWGQVAAFALPGGAACRPGGVDISPGLQTAGRLCLSGREVAVSGQLVPTGPGRLALRGADPRGIGQAWWVLWVDDGYRTVVIGTPSGDFGFILDRSGVLPPDRRRAAEDILAWNGYDPARLVYFGPQSRR